MKAKKQNATNPYLPLHEYIPDGEPRLFDGRLYVYGSHDEAGGSFFCPGDYVLWSAPEDDLANWRCDGTIYRRGQDPADPEGALELFAPDVVRGADGRYYLFYCLRMLRQFGVAVSDSPAGPFTFYGHVRRPNGTLFDDHMPYDPSVLVDDDGRVYLYYGFSSTLLAQRFGTEISPGCLVVQLEADMLTTRTRPKLCVPWEGLAAGTGFEGHAYFEAPSMRKLGGLYYLVYSSQWCRELCYAVSRRPDRGFAYGGVIVDNADLGCAGRTTPAAMPGNNHGGLATVRGQTYIFYHRHTHCHSFSRQGCAEAVEIAADGSIPQAEMTSCGLNGGPLPAQGCWPAAIACHLAGPQAEKMLDFRNADPAETPYITEEDAPANTAESGAAGKIQFIHNILGGTTVGYKYFAVDDAPGEIVLMLRGEAEGTLSLHVGGPGAGAVSSAALRLRHNTRWQPVALAAPPPGTHSIYFAFTGAGSFDFKEFCWRKT